LISFTVKVQKATAFAIELSFYSETPHTGCFTNVGPFEI